VVHNAVVSVAVSGLLVLSSKGAGEDVSEGRGGRNAHLHGRRIGAGATQAAERLLHPSLNLLRMRPAHHCERTGAPRSVSAERPTEPRGGRAGGAREGSVRSGCSPAAIDHSAVLWIAGWARSALHGNVARVTHDWGDVYCDVHVQTSRADARRLSGDTRRASGRIWINRAYTHAEAS
jgi:hypothetical protein